MQFIYALPLVLLGLGLGQTHAAPTPVMPHTSEPFARRILEDTSAATTELDDSIRAALDIAGQIPALISADESGWLTIKVPVPAAITAITELPITPLTMAPSPVADAETRAAALQAFTTGPKGKLSVIPRAPYPFEGADGSKLRADWVNVFPDGREEAAIDTIVREMTEKEDEGAKTGYNLKSIERQRANIEPSVAGKAPALMKRADTNEDWYADSGSAPMKLDAEFTDLAPPGDKFQHAATATEYYYGFVGKGGRAMNQPERRAVTVTPVRESVTILVGPGAITGGMEEVPVDEVPVDEEPVMEPAGKKIGGKIVRGRKPLA
ncbi:hypothetical protein BZA05DRAFT_442034 [Tricharina praecox]|uniref:uncharacterized protein n=1 Tax=Tricharina praecox TaxID=43433 RepID=UPI002220472C|nr:uncharacterized protein BZA05DRAFT_442034 [Tricharina praecox]KAI5856340.1 hypothetical protein BZA05DRAFT_442034 [Tricharina praecox]